MDHAITSIVESVSKSPQINNYTISGLLDPHKPLTLEIDYTLNDSLLSSKESLYRLPELWTSYFISTQEDKNRRHTFSIYSPLKISINRSANNATLLNHADWNEKSPLSSARVVNSDKGSNVLQSIQYRRKAGRWKAEEFKPYKEINIKTVSQSQLILRK